LPIVNLKVATNRSRSAAEIPIHRGRSRNRSRRSARGGIRPWRTQNPAKPYPAPYPASLTYVVSRASRPRVPRASCPRLSTCPATPIRFLSSAPAPLAHPAQTTTQSHPFCAKQTQFQKHQNHPNPLHPKDLPQFHAPQASKKQTQSNSQTRPWRANLSQSRSIGSAPGNIQPNLPPIHAPFAQNKPNQTQSRTSEAGSPADTIYSPKSPTAIAQSDV